MQFRRNHDGYGNILSFWSAVGCGVHVPLFKEDVASGIQSCRIGDGSNILAPIYFQPVYAGGDRYYWEINVQRLYLVAVNCWRHFGRTMPMRPEFFLNLMDVCKLQPHDCSTTYATECLFVSIIEEPISRLGNWNPMATELQTSQTNSKATKSSAHDPGPSSKVGLRFSNEHIIHVAL